MKLIGLIKKGIQYLNNQEIELRIRMLFFLEYAALFACIVGTVAMLAFATSITVLFPNFVLIIFCILGIYLSQIKKKYDFAVLVVVIGCTFLALPYMFFTAGGNQSGMPIWFLFGIIFTCLMAKGRMRLILPIIITALDSACMLIGNYHEEWIIKLEDSQAEFFDMFQSFLLVSAVIFISLMIYLSSYDRQRIMMEKNSAELKRAMSTDPLTGIANRHAFFEDTAKYTESSFLENLTIVTLDINGLKSINDTKGHAAGDELIISASKIMVSAFSKFGQIYRTGGDEFVALLFCNDSDTDKLNEILSSELKAYNDKNGTSIAIAIGVASWNANKEKHFFDLMKLADSNMYKNKSKYYIETGIDRRKR